MQSNTNNYLDLEKKTCIGQYGMPPPSENGTWTQLHDNTRAKIQMEQITKAGKSDKPKTKLCKLI